MANNNSNNRGFGASEPQRQRDQANRGGRAAHEQGGEAVENTEENQRGQNRSGQQRGGRSMDQDLTDATE